MDGPLPLQYADAGLVSGKYTEITTRNGERDAQDERDAKNDTVEMSTTTVSSHNGATRNTDNAKVRRKVLTVIGDPLPLDYLRNNAENNGDNDNVFDNEVDETESRNTSVRSTHSSHNNESSSGEEEAIKVKKHIRIADLGNPLPLPYTPGSTDTKVSILSAPVSALETTTPVRRASVGAADEKDILTMPLAPSLAVGENGHNSKPFTRRAISMYDFGSPLPLKYVNTKINTQRYLKRNQAETEVAGVTQYGSKASIDVIHHNGGRECDSSLSKTVRVSEGINTSNSALEDDSDTNQQVGKEEDNHEGEEEEEEESEDTELYTMNQTEILQLIHDRDYTTLEERLQDADFRLQLLRYARQLKKQHDFLCKILHGEPERDASSDEENETTVCQSATRTLRSQLRSAAVGALVFVGLCGISYALAD
jgi:hypothetical protein